MPDIGLGNALFTAVMTLTAGAVGLRGSAWLQERDQARRQRNTAMALREDLARIQAILGVPGVGGVPSLDVGSEPEVPSVHPWVEGLITDLASAEPEVVRRFLALQHDLQKRGLRLDTYLAAARRIASISSIRVIPLPSSEIANFGDDDVESTCIEMFRAPAEIELSTTSASAVTRV